MGHTHTHTLDAALGAAHSHLKEEYSDTPVDSHCNNGMRKCSFYFNGIVPGIGAMFGTIAHRHLLCDEIGASLLSDSPLYVSMTAIDRSAWVHFKNVSM